MNDVSTAFTINLQERISDFAQFLRANDLVIDPGTLVDLHQVAALGFAHSRERFRSATKNCACRDRADWQRFDKLFDVFWQAHRETAEVEAEQGQENGEQSLSLAGQQKLLGLAGTSEKQRLEEEFFGAGDFKALSLADFRFVFNQRQMLEIEKLVDRMARQARRRFSRRVYSSTRGYAIDMRKSLRQSLRYMGQPADLRFCRKRQRLRRFVLLLDISQSMDVYSRLFLRFARILMTVFQRSDAYVFNTELHELGRGYARLSESDFESVLNQHGKGWLGGTKIAQSLEQFNDVHLTSRVDSKTVVLIFSDGCDTDVPERLASATQIIQRRSGKLIWVNPLLGRFEPGEADRYMDPVSPFTDSYCSAHNLASLLELEKELLG
ncbi:MAG: VWA domain-containing protein [Granulosicoccus sp.]